MKKDAYWFRIYFPFEFSCDWSYCLGLVQSRLGEKIKTKNPPTALPHKKTQTNQNLPGFLFPPVQVQKVTAEVQKNFFGGKQSGFGSCLRL